MAGARLHNPTQGLLDQLVFDHKQEAKVKLAQPSRYEWISNLRVRHDSMERQREHAFDPTQNGKAEMLDPILTKVQRPDERERGI